jgi:hypothetical protein
MQDGRFALGVFVALSFLSSKISFVLQGVFSHHLGKEVEH